MGHKDRCIWCGNKQPKFYKDKPYCIECSAKCVRECVCCHKPYNDLSFFDLHPDHCNSCQKKMEKVKMKKEVERWEEEQRKRSMSPLISVSDGENLQSEIDEEVSSLLDAPPTPKAQDRKAEGGENSLESTSKKSKRTSRISDSSEDDGYDEDEEADLFLTKKGKKTKKKQKDATQTLLKLLDVGGKKQVSFEVNRKKKRKYNRRQVTSEEGDDSSAFEELIHSLGNYKRSCPSRTSVQVFLMSK